MFIWILKLPPHLAYVATIPCETLMSAIQAIKDKLQSNVATYLRCDGVVNHQIKKGLLLSLWVKKLKSVNIWQSYKQERGCLMHTAKRRSKCTRQSRYSWHSAGYLSCPFPMLEYKYICPLKYTETILSNSSRKLLRFEMLIAVKNKFVVLFIVIVDTLLISIACHRADRWSTLLRICRYVTCR